jgi:Ca2+-binding EF-hand superfamily protein
MGPFFSEPFQPNDKISGQERNILPMCIELGYTIDDVNKLYKLFDVYDTNGEGFLTIDSFSSHLPLPNRNLSLLIMRLFDANDSNVINFEEFLVACWNILTLKNKEWISFIFHLLDLNGSGKILLKEIEYIIDYVLEIPNKKESELHTAMKRHSDWSTGAISEGGFQHINHHCPYFLASFSKMCTKLSRKSLGLKRWR